MGGSREKLWEGRVGWQAGDIHNCTLRRFNIRGLIEGMLRTVMGNICWGEVTKHRWPAMQKGHRAKVTRRPKKGNRVEEEKDG